MKEQIKTLKSVLSGSGRKFTNNNCLNLFGMNPLLQPLQKTVELSINVHKELVYGYSNSYGFTVVFK